MLLGDLNLWANSSQDPVAVACIDHLEGLGLQQLVCGPTHASGHTLDLIFRQNLEVKILENESLPWTDHHVIKFMITKNTPLTKTLKPVTMHWTRSQKKLHSELFKTILGNKIKTIPSHQSATETLDAINTALLQSADLVAPKRKTCIRKYNSSWFNDQLSSLKQERRRAEAAWKRSTTDENRAIYNETTKKYHKEIFLAKKKLFLQDHHQCPKPSSRTLQVG